MLLKLYKKISGKYKINDDLLLYKPGETVIYKPFKSTETPRSAVIDSVTPHTAVGDFSYMYIISINEQHIKVYE